jgi:WD40 repeat protein
VELLRVLGYCGYRLRVLGLVFRKMIGHTDAVTGVCFGPEGKAISGSIDTTLLLWDLTTGKKAGVLPGHENYVFGVAYNDKARLAASCGRDLSIRLWDVETGKEVRKLTGHGGNNIVSLCFSADGKRLLSSDIDTLRIWDAETGKEQKQLKNVNAFSAAFSPDGTRFVTGGYSDKSVRVWDAATCKELRRLEGHSELVTGVAFFPDGKRVVSASCDHTARIWNVPN